MSEGHPFLTEDLDQLRRMQRRVLRSIPDWLISRHAPDVSPAEHVSSADHALVEELLRTRAGALMASAESLLSGMKEECAKARFKRFWESEADPYNTRWARDFDSSQEIKRVIAAEAEDAPRGLEIHTLKDEPAAPDLYRLVVVLLFADFLAGDGYTDPRVRAGTATGSL